MQSHTITRLDETLVVGSPYRLTEHGKRHREAVDRGELPRNEVCMLGLYYNRVEPVNQVPFSTSRSLINNIGGADSRGC